MKHKEVHPTECLEMPADTQIVMYIKAKRKVGFFKLILLLFGIGKFPKLEHIPVWESPLPPFYTPGYDPRTMAVRYRGYYYLHQKHPFRYFRIRIITSEMGFPTKSRTFVLKSYKTNG